MSKARQHFARLMLIIFVCIASLVCSSEASAASDIGGLDLAGYCDMKYDYKPTKPERYNADGWVVLKEQNAYGWKCVQWSVYYPGGTFYPVPVTVEFAIDTNDVCRSQYGSEAYAQTNNWTDPYSWRCYR